MSTSKTLTLPEKVVDLIGVTSAAMEKAAAAETAATLQRQKIAELIPAAVTALVTGERIRPEQREKAAQALADPVTALELLTKIATHRNVAERPLGSATPTGTTKTASANGGMSPFVGGRSASVKQSDIVLFQRLGLPAPTE